MQAFCPRSFALSLGLGILALAKVRIACHGSAGCLGCLCLCLQHLVLFLQARELCVTCRAISALPLMLHHGVLQPALDGH